MNVTSGDDQQRRVYDPVPCYPLAAGSVDEGHAALARAMAASRPRVLALDGPAALDWNGFAERLRAALTGEGGLSVATYDVRRHHAPPEEVRRRTQGSALDGDPNFVRLSGGDLADVFDGLPAALDPAPADTLVVYGPGAALVGHDELWYVEVAKRHTLAAVQGGQAPNVGHPAGEPGVEKVHLYVDWPLLDRHRERIYDRIARFVDAADLAAPRSVRGEDLRATLDGLARRPFRTRPAYLSGSWGGQWLRKTVGVEPDAPNVALSYELIAPESGVLLGPAPDAAVEVPFAMLVAARPREVMGEPVTERFGTSFPIRFDYLDTVEGGNLSVHCHPRPDYMKEVFGWEYTQHETYYVMVTRPGAKVYLGLREDADMAEFRRESHLAEDEGRFFDVERYVQTFPADPHRLFLVPAGTPHASGEGNVVLEVSATPYLYSLRFFDWVRRDAAGALRPVHVEHAFANLDVERRGAAVGEELAGPPRPLRGAPGEGREVLLGALPEMFFEVRRLEFDEHVGDDTGGRFHVLNLVEGEEAVIETAAGDRHPLAYAETIVIPASVGPYRISRVRGPACRILKALVP
ncbi:hypothetical protein DP939_17455 [Spongiactinospora rosea]|uniref:Mannose-6-phosphate isomerase class I n=1 Tax=Spongiactinospora rosea TaxID=2248750 RepID=A0A366LZK7_9ACTN|nr:class I mannose-6-phosphate isomerase [Spongiactinospora rosea]RBQ18973.1 hypothetical protein DP939_17455 [Spongiactinospora rosea]